MIQPTAPDTRTIDEIHTQAMARSIARKLDLTIVRDGEEVHYYFATQRSYEAAVQGAMKRGYIIKPQG